MCPYLPTNFVICIYMYILPFNVHKLPTYPFLSICRHMYWLLIFSLISSYQSLSLPTIHLSPLYVYLTISFERILCNKYLIRQYLLYRHSYRQMVILPTTASRTYVYASLSCFRTIFCTKSLSVSLSITLFPHKNVYWWLLLLLYCIIVSSAFLYHYKKYFYWTFISNLPSLFLLLYLFLTLSQTYYFLSLSFAPYLYFPPYPSLSIVSLYVSLPLCNSLSH